MKSEDDQISAIIRSYKVCQKSIEIRLKEHIKRNTEFDENLSKILSNKLEYYKEKILSLEEGLQMHKQQDRK